MKVFKFLSWWWNNRSTDEKVLTVIISLLVSFVPMCLIFGLKGFFIVLGVMGVLLVAGVSYLLYCLVMQQWDKFNEEKEKEAKEIMRRLAGESRW